MVLLLLVIARGADFFSTWVATPGLKLEANPLARRLGWRWGLWLNLLIAVGVAVWVLPAVTLITTSLLVAARNFQAAWLSRSMGEHAYREWLATRVRRVPLGLFFFCLGAQSLVYLALGAALVVFGQGSVVLLGMGVGFVAYAVVVPLFTWLGVRGILRQRQRPELNFSSDVDVLADPNRIPRTGRPGQSDPGFSPTVG